MVVNQKNKLDEMENGKTGKPENKDSIAGSPVEQFSSSSELQSQLDQLTSQLTQAKESERRALADYQNLVRRQQEDRARLIKLSTFELISALILPLDHLSLAADQLQDKGLNLVVTQLWQTLNTYGLEEIKVLGEKFDATRMEVVETQGEGDTVQKIVKRGYLLNGEVIQVAKVVVG